jgi:Mg2+/Co2+ transporter CorB
VPSSLTIPQRSLAVILRRNSLANIASSVLATILFLTLFGEAGVVYATVVMTVIVVLFAEVLPKTYAILNADRMALAVAPAVRFVVAVLAPVTATMQFLVRHRFGVHNDDAEVLSAHEKSGRHRAHHKEGGGKLDRDMLGGVLDLRQ